MPCAKTILSALLRQAYRRPIVPADLETPLTFFQDGSNAAGNDHAGDAFDTGIESSLRFILTSPEFLFRTEHEPAGSQDAPAPGAIYRVSDLDLAARAPRFFLWSMVRTMSCGCAARGAAAQRLEDPQVARKASTPDKLNDKRAYALVENFAGQWLQLLTTAQPGPRFREVFPRFRRQPAPGLSARKPNSSLKAIIREDRERDRAAWSALLHLLQ